MAETKKIVDMEQWYCALGFDDIVESIVPYLNTEDGLDFFIAQRPKFQEEAVLSIQAQVKEFSLRSQIKKYSEDMYVYSIIQMLQEGKKRNLKIYEIGKVAILLQVLLQYKNWLIDTKTMVNYTQSKAMFDGDVLLSLNTLTLLVMKFFDKKGEIKRESVEGLVAIDHKKASLIKNRYEVARKFINKNINMCSDKNPTIKEGRLVIPINISYKSSVDGIIHGMSGSAQTAYVEIKSLYEYNNSVELLELEEEKILQELANDLTEKIMACDTSIIKSYHAYIEFDVIKAQHNFACKYKGVFPQLSTHNNDESHEGREYDIYLPEAMHPLITNCSPINIFCKKDKKQLVVTGPNAGGKTVVLKTLGLLSLMNQSGIMIPVQEGAILPIFENIQVVIGDYQNIKEGESTFSAHIKKVYEALPKEIDKGIQEEGAHLLIFDELCAGTDEQEGGTLAWAILEFLLCCDNYYTFVTTHSTLLKQYAIMHDNVEVVAMENGGDKKYQVVYGSTGMSEARVIAKKVGMQASILERQKDLLDQYGTNTQELLQKLHHLIVQTQKKKELSSQLAREVSFQKKDLLAWEHYLKEKEIMLRRNDYQNGQTVLQDMKQYIKKIEKKEKYLERVINEYEEKLKDTAPNNQPENTPDNTADLSAHASILTSEPSEINHAQKIDQKVDQQIDHEINGSELAHLNDKVQEFTTALSHTHEELVADTREYTKKLGEISLGDEVIILQSGVKGVVVSVLKNKKYAVRAGILTLTLSREDIKKQHETQHSSYIERHDREKYVVNTDDTYMKSHDFIIDRDKGKKQLHSVALDLRGKSVEEALRLVEIHINDAVLAHIYSFSIIHGKGNGVLAREIHAMLRTHTLVIRHEFASPEEGGAGKTWVHLQ